MPGVDGMRGVGAKFWRRLKFLRPDGKYMGKDGSGRLFP